MMKRRTVALAMMTLAIGGVVVPATSASADSGSGGDISYANAVCHS
ncbi:hypothetical protein [Rathayibacter rathayi]|nr:hypothetical protein [Rathayibacter rathayi]